VVGHHSPGEDLEAVLGRLSDGPGGFGSRQSCSKFKMSFQVQQKFEKAEMFPQKYEET
jgi:hypothetical protein